ncbi:unnamed protein product [Lymnaea stagnalis]|uniref:Uncharacterized protein n=1 Tax=Lymnaea stagnalis TaxID=6523 RepID=A0AAV2H6R2_LYMST
MESRVCFRMSGLLSLVILSVCFGHVAATFSVCKPRSCISGKATCLNKKCVCLVPHVWGDGTFMCYKQNQVATEVKNDPRLTTFNNESTNFPYPCRYLLTAVKQELKNLLNIKTGTCTIQVHAFNKRHNGKIIVYGYEVALKFEALLFSKSLSIITYGTHGKVTEGGTDNSYVTSGTYGNHLKSSAVAIFSDLIRNIYVKRYHLPLNNQYVVEVDACGFRATFVPYDTTLGLAQPNIPGLSVAINCAHHPQWLLKEKVMGLAPADAGGLTFAGLKTSYPGLDTVQAMLQRAITSGTLQSQPDASPKCSALKTAVDTCDKMELVKAYKLCTPILETSHLVKCISNNNPSTSNSDAVLGVFITCVNHFCNGGGQCQLFKSVYGNCNDPALKKLISAAACTP